MFRQLVLPIRAFLKSAVLENAGYSVGESAPSSQALVRSVGPLQSSGLHTTSAVYLGRKLRKAMGTSFEQTKLVAEGENSNILQVRQVRDSDIFPDLHLPTRLFSGIMFKDLPILNVKASKNNTIINVTDSGGIPYMTRSCGCDGFKNARKGTNVAAQATGFTIGKKMMQRGYRTVRVRVQGLGPGRLSSLRGISIAGVQIISITDNTPVSWNPPRARKQRRV